MRILGIDPGYAIVGYGVIDFFGNRFRPIDFGAVLTKAGVPFPARLEQIYNEIELVIIKNKPQAMAIEKLYFQNNQKTAIDVAQARGVVLLAAQKYQIPIFEYTPLQIKTMVTGYGQAKKPQVMEMVRRHLNLEKVPKPDDTADALAVAMCHAQAGGTRLRMLLNSNTSASRVIKPDIKK